MFALTGSGAYARLTKHSFIICLKMRSWTPIYVLEIGSTGWSPTDPFDGSDFMATCITVQVASIRHGLREENSTWNKQWVE